MQLHKTLEKRMKLGQSMQSREPAASEGAQPISVAMHASSIAAMSAVEGAQCNRRSFFTHAMHAATMGDEGGELTGRHVPRQSHAYEDLLVGNLSVAYAALRRVRGLVQRGNFAENLLEGSIVVRNFSGGSVRQNLCYSSPALLFACSLLLLPVCMIISAHA
jgi:hypothetical protein